MSDVKERIAAEACDILERFESIDLNSLEGGSHVGDSVSSLSALLGCDFHLISEASSDADRGTHERAVFSPMHDGQRPNDLVDVVWPIDTATIVRRDAGYSLCRVVTATPQEIRGKVKIAPARTVFVYSGMLGDNGEWWAERRICGLISNNWIPIDVEKTIVKGGVTRRYRSDLESKTEYNLTVAMEFSLALTERYEWHAAFGTDDGPRLLLPTSSAGAAALFKERERRPDQTRRSALRHWVQNYYRSAEENLTFVRDHLRGATKFSWKDLPCELMVSQYDLERNEFFKNQAAQWRATRKHNSVKVRLKKAV
jgi:hypothetical protein